MNKRPQPIKPGDLIRAKWLNESNEAGVHAIRGGPGILVRHVGDKVIVSAERKISPRSGTTPPLLFPVLMAQTAGDAGDENGPCDFVYTVADVESNTIEAEVNPSTSPHTHKRPNLGTMTAATAGLAYYGTDSEGQQELRVVWCNEVISVSECT